eukprot:CAMPEP_0184854972 /NCGR_PEP_ID=MMETSP0580-20130426/331_1 /TAXON_ID=1118495 /ORGANISM="Dactyliosolen fragilissimus" /LENGTH=153 /DNA_ID=CAMNT_0027349365 /DNA_START=58 /DNA_END=519 /DNA_ORIENTATION=+
MMRKTTPNSILIVIQLISLLCISSPSLANAAFVVQQSHLVKNAAASAAASAHTPIPSSYRRSTNTPNSSSSLRNGNMEEIEFRIYPDGRIEEKVRGVKGGNCHKVTEEINKNLGKVVDTKPTEEMYEQELVIDQIVEVKAEEGGSDWDGSSTW